MTRIDHDDIRADQTEAGRELRSFLAERGDRSVFLEHEVKGLLGRLGLTVPRGVFIGKGQTLTPPPLAYPLVAKVSSARIVSKSDVGGVRRGIAGAEELRKAVAELLAIEGAEGVIVEETAPPGTEVIVGGIVDSQFGPVVMFGLGGVFVELYRDVAFALAPLTDAEARRLVGRVKGSRLLAGFRGWPPIDMDALARVIVTVSELMATGVPSEIDLNPVSLYPGGAVVLDAKMEVSRRSSA